MRHTVLYHSFDFVDSLALSLSCLLNIFPDKFLGMSSVNSTPPRNFMKEATLPEIRKIMFLFQSYTFMHIQLNRFSFG